MRRVAALAALFLLGASGRAGAQVPDTLTAIPSVRPAVVRVGERVTVRVVVPASLGAQLAGPKAPQAVESVDLLESGPAAAGKDSTAWEMTLAFFESGDLKLPPLPLVLRGASGDVPVKMSPYTVSVLSSLPDTLSKADIRDIKAPVSYPTKWILWRVLLLVGLLALLAGAVVWWRRRPGPAPVPRPEIVIDPETEALTALRTLDEEALAARGQVKEHYARLSLILRAYMERRLRLPAVEATTEEIRRDLERRPALPEAERGALIALLEEADLVKFAKYTPAPQAPGEALVRGRAWVERVGPVLRPPPVAAEGAA